MTTQTRQGFTSICAATAVALGLLAAPARAAEVWVTPTQQQDVGGLGVASNTLWPVTPLGAVRFAMSVPDDMQAFQHARIALIPQSADAASMLNVLVCSAKSGDMAAASCAGPFAQAFSGAANQFVEVEVGSLIASHIGTPGSSYLAIVAYTTPTTATDHLVGLRFMYTPTAPAGAASLAANTFTGTQSAPAFVGDGSGLTNISATTAQNALQLGGVAANQYVVTSDGRLSDARPPLAGSPNYIQNTTAPQAVSNFNITGNGMAGGALAAGTQFNIGADRVLAVSGTQSTNTFVGVQAGNANPTGTDNSFFGHGAGAAATTSSSNSFFGSSAGLNDQIGANNAFVGASAGLSNTNGSQNAFFGSTAGRSNGHGLDNVFVGYASGQSNRDSSQNTFVGSSAGLNNGFGNSNTFVGFQTGLFGTGANNSTFIGWGSGSQVGFGSSNTFVGSGTNGPPFGTALGDNNDTLLGSNAALATQVQNATAIGANAAVSQDNSLVLGSINGVNGGSADTSVGIGTTAPNGRLHVNGFVRVTNGGVFVANPNTLIITSPNGACWGITVSNVGAVSAFSLTCP